MIENEAQQQRDRTLADLRLRAQLRINSETEGERNKKLRKARQRAAEKQITKLKKRGLKDWEMRGKLLRIEEIE